MEIYLLCIPMFHRTLLIVHRLLVFLVWKRIIIVMAVYQCKEQKESCLFIFLCFFRKKNSTFIVCLMWWQRHSYRWHAELCFTLCTYIQVHKRIHELIIELKQISREKFDVFNVHGVIEINLINYFYGRWKRTLQKFTINYCCYMK